MAEELVVNTKHKLSMLYRLHGTFLFNVDVVLHVHQAGGGIGVGDGESRSSHLGQSGAVAAYV